MAHNRKRYAETYLNDAMGFSPLVGVLGQRQVGKTTLVEEYVGSSYVTFDDDAQASAAELAPQQFLSQFSVPVAIDECQKVPKIFPALKLRVQKSKRPGQFILTGSVRFTSRKAIQESLTGRIHNIEILPLNLAEINKQPLGSFIDWPHLSEAELQKYISKRLSWFSQKQFTAFLDHGGLPGMCFLRKQAHRTAKFKTHLETLLQRDIRLVIETTVPYVNLLGLLKYMAQHQGIPLVVKDASRATGISQVTVDKLIFAFESLFLIRRIPGSGDRKADIFYLEDQGMATYLTKEGIISDQQRFAFSQLFAAAHYSAMNDYALSYMETKGGAHVPFVFAIKGQTIGFILNPSESLSLSSMKTAQALLERHPKAFVYCLSESTTVMRIAERIVRVPLMGIV